ncbi:unannotated protein [freshwater metagenome]|uniref:Unannotated protein n=1 Tax=freshwater metagenome TaxID=449393 RepID=A0A6J5YFK7_9ZZZZ
MYSSSVSIARDTQTNDCRGSSTLAPVRRHPTEHRILEEVVRIIDEQGEAAVRIHDLQTACDVTAPSIYHFFGSREGLVIEAQAERLVRSFDANDAIIDAQLASATSRDELREAMRSFLEIYWRPERAPIRAQRLSALGSAIGRPELIARFDQVIRDYVVDRTERLRPFQDRGWLQADFDLRFINYWMIGVLFGRVYLEFGGESGPFPEWDAITEKALEYILFGPEQVERAVAPVTDRDRSGHRQNAGGQSPNSYDRTTNRHPTESKILEEAVRVIDLHVEAAVRIHDIEVACEVTAPSIYHFFKSREGLVIEAQAERLKRSFAELDLVIDAGLHSVSSRDELRRATRSIVNLYWQPERTAVRAQRLSALGSAIGRPELSARFHEVICEYVELMSVRLEPLQERGWILPDLDLRAFNFWMMGILLGRVYIEFGGNTGPFPEWNAMTGAAIEYILFGLE